MKPSVPYSVYIDDERFPKKHPPIGDFWIICRNMSDFKRFIHFYGIPKYISFDHDLGDKEPSGKDIANYLVEQWLDENIVFDHDFEYNIHSANSVGRENIKGLLDNFLDFKRKGN